MNWPLKVLIAILMMLFAHTMLHAATEPDAPKLSVKAIRISEKVELDGKLSEPFWKDENAIETFVQRDPVEGSPATERTVVDVVYDDDAIYIGARMYDPQPQLIEARLGRKDVTLTSDRFDFYVDPYCDHRTGYYFGVNAAGTLYDGTLFNDVWDDNSWDGVWDAKVHIDEKGWTAEMRIPYSQMRFQKKDHYVWGVNFKRTISRKNETDYLVFQPKNGSGFVSRFPELDGISNVTPPRAIELLPYITSKSAFTTPDAGDPFHDGSEYDPGIGADLKMGLGTALTLNATINPDFGQVEVDPAVVNLSDGETFFPEKRPFFIEGSNNFDFGNGGATNYWGFNWGGPQFFYSRRIGRPPQAVPDDADFQDVPSTTTILGAGKLTGKILGDWNLGTLSAVTGRESGDFELDSARYSQEVEPVTYYGVSRLQRQFNDGKQGIGFITTLAHRFFHDQSLEDDLNGSSLVGGIDGWTYLDSKKVWVITDYTGFSYVTGTASRITDLQENSQHYFQRPDAQEVELDPFATSLKGAVTRIAINKEKGNVLFNSAFGAITPGFDSNDMGFMYRANVINFHVESGYKWTQPTKHFRFSQIDAAVFRSLDFAGNTTWAGYFLTDYTEFPNYYNATLTLAWNPETTLDNTLTRGGPSAVNLPGYEIDFNANSDSRKKWVFGLGTNNYMGDSQNTHNFYASVEWKPVANVSVSLGPSFDRNHYPAQWIDNFDDPHATATYGMRSVFGDLRQETFAANLRVNWTFTPKLSLQFFGQPLVSSGKYTDIKDLARPRSFEFNHYQNTGTIELHDDTYTVDPDGAGPSQPFTFDNPDFNFKSLRGNAVLRWEYRSGSAIYFVWTQTKQQDEVNGNFQFGQSLTKLWNAPADNIFMVKFTYYWNL